MIESMVIAALLRNPKEVLRVDLSRDCFTRYGAVFDAMRTLSSQGTTPDAFTIADLVGDRDLIASLGRLQIDSPGTADNLPHYAGELRQSKKARQLLAIANHIQSEIEALSDPDVIAGAAIERLSRLSAVGGIARSHDSASMMIEVIDHLDAVFSTKMDGGLVGVPTGIAKVDTFLGGMHPSDLVVVGARPSVGKTSFMLSIALNALTTGKRVGIVSAEMSAVQIGSRLVSMVADIPAFRLRDASLEDKDWARLSAAAGKIRGLPLMLLDHPSCRLADIVMHARMWAETVGLDVIMVDYLTRIRAEEAENRTLAVGEIVAGLKTLARTLNIPVVVLAQLNRGINNRSDKRPNMSDLRDSGMIEQEADQILMLYRPHVHDHSVDPAAAEVIIDKNRHGECAIAKVRFAALTMRWSDPIDGQSGENWD